MYYMCAKELCALIKKIIQLKVLFVLLNQSYCAPNFKKNLYVEAKTGVNMFYFKNN